MGKPLFGEGAMISREVEVGITWARVGLRLRCAPWFRPPPHWQHLPHPDRCPGGEEGFGAWLPLGTQDD